MRARCRSSLPPAPPPPQSPQPRHVPARPSSPARAHAHAHSCAGMLRLRRGGEAGSAQARAARRPSPRVPLARPWSRGSKKSWHLLAASLLESPVPLPRLPPRHWAPAKEYAACPQGTRTCRGPALETAKNGRFVGKDEDRPGVLVLNLSLQFSLGPISSPPPAREMHTLSFL